jgi:hypothetical protein
VGSPRIIPSTVWTGEGLDNRLHDRRRYPIAEYPDPIAPLPMLDLGVFETLDLSGDEFAQPIEVFAPLYRRAKASGLRLKAHVGEWVRPMMCGGPSNSSNSTKYSTGSQSNFVAAASPGTAPARSEECPPALPHAGWRACHRMPLCWRAA